VSEAARAYAALVEALGLLAGILIGVGTLLIALDVALRNLFVTGIPWLIEVVEYGMYAVTFLAAPWVLRHGGHVRVDVLSTVLPAPFARLLDRIADTIGLAASCVLLWYAAKVTLASMESGSLIIKSVIFPEWWMLAVMPVASLLLAVEWARRLFRAEA
jgi:TRAP-type C4-dicarboxylate transport system permease small subunit